MADSPIEEMVIDATWPSVEMKRMPNGQMGIHVGFPLPPQIVQQTGFDAFSMNMEPWRAKLLRNKLTSYLKDLGHE